MRKKIAPYPSSEIQELFDAIHQIQSKEEAVYFFRDLLTIAELTEFANRWQIVKRLVANIPYETIAKELKVSTTTVSRVAHWLHDGMGGYRALAFRLFDTRKNPDYHEPPRFKGGKLAGLRNPHSL